MFQVSYYNKKTVRDIEVFGKKILLRCDFNVPLDSEKNITDTKRIDESLKTIEYLLDKGAKLIVCSHLGSPGGVFNPEFSLKPVAKYLSQKLKCSVKLSSEVLGEVTQKIVSDLKSGEMCLLENLRFEPGEVENSKEFSEKLASLAEIYVNDAFGVCHRAHASVVGVTEFLPSACGFLIEKEISEMSKILSSPERPFIAILGGAKVSNKIEIINNLLDKIDVLIVGGGMAYTFTNALGYPIGNSICENDKVPLAKDVMVAAKDKGVKLVLPIDFKVSDKYSPDGNYKIVDADKIPENFMGLDIGPETIKIFKETLQNAKTILWNGPMGVFEWDNFAEGTFEVGKAIADSGAISIIGGGDSAAAMRKLGLTDKMTHVSTGGGASLEFLGGKILPGLSSIDDK